MVELPEVTVIKHWQNFSLELISEVYNGILYIEEWKPINGYEHKYEVSSFGRIKSLKYARTNEHRILKQSKTKDGYLRVDLVKNDNHKYVHILVANSFILNPYNKPEVNHKLGNTEDNRSWMLEWATKSEQMHHAINVLGFVPTAPPNPGRGVLNFKARSVRQLNKNTNELINIYTCIKDAEIEVGVNTSNIVAALKGKTKTSGGYKWEYV